MKIMRARLALIHNKIEIEMITVINVLQNY